MVMMYPTLISDNPGSWALIWPLCLALICKLRRSRRIERWGNSFPPSNLQHRTNRCSDCRALTDLRPRSLLGVSTGNICRGEKICTIYTISFRGRPCIWRWASAFVDDPDHFPFLGSAQQFSSYNW